MNAPRSPMCACMQWPSPQIPQHACTPALCAHAPPPAVRPQVLLLMEILYAFSRYLEAIVLIPQFVLLYKRQKYELWVLVFTILLGAESASRGITVLTNWSREQEVDPYGEQHERY
jgi:hypothetical protein